MVLASSAVRYKLSPMLLNIGYSCLLNAITMGTLNQVWLRLGKFDKTGLILNLIDYPKFEIIKTGSSGLITNYE